MVKLSFNRCLKLILSFSVFLFYACEYDNNEMNYHELTPPEKNASVVFNLADIPEGNPIYIYAPTYLTYKLNITSGTIVYKEFYLNNQLMDVSNGYIFLHPYNVPENINSTLKLKVKLTSGTGSLAEILGGEKSEFEFNYSVKYVNPDIKLDIKQRVNHNKHLELYWDKPNIEGLEIESYKIYHYNSFDEILVAEITNPDETSYIDNSYVYGSKTFRIVVKYKSNKIEDKEAFYTVKYNEFTSSMFTTSSAEPFKLKIKWNNPNNIACKYVLKWRDEVINIKEGTSEVSILRPTFPMSDTQYYELYILPLHADFNNYEKYPKIINYFQEKFFGEKYEENARHIQFNADVKNNYILAMRPDQNHFGFRAYNKESLIIQNNADISFGYNIYTEEFTTSPTTGRVAIHCRINDRSTDPKIYVYSDYTLNTLLGTFSTDDFPVFFLTDDDKIIINNNDRKLNRIYDIKTNKLLNNQRESTGTDFRPAISPDGKYIFNYLRIDNTWYKLYSYENGDFNLIKHQTNSRVNNIVFNPKRQNHVVMQTIDNKFSIYEIPSLNKIATFDGEFICFDSFTGNILYLDKDFNSNSQLNILNDTYDKVIFKITTNLNFYYYYARLINNHLVVRDYYINITK